MAAEKEIAFSSVPAEGKARSYRWHLGRLQFIWFPLAYVIFGVVGAISSLGCLLLSVLLPHRWGRPLGQKLIQQLFAFFVWFMEWSGLARFEFHDVPTLRDHRGAIIVANHPSLLDVVFLVSRLPRVFCLMKAGILSNLVLCGTARLAGYVDNRCGRRMVEECVARLQRGETLVVFPEGTRTVQSGVNPFKMGFALISQLAGAPVQTVLLEPGSSFLGKRWPFFKPPAQFPLRYSLRLGRQFVAEPGQHPKEFGKAVENYFRVSLRQGVGTVDGNP